MVLLEHHDAAPGERTIVASFSVKRFRGRGIAEEIAHVEVHADGTVYSRSAEGALEQRAFGELERHRADALLWLTAVLLPTP